MNRFIVNRGRALCTVCCLFVLPLAWTGCGKKSTGAKSEPGEPKAVSKLVAAEAENHASDAAFAVQIKDYARAAESLAKAVKLRDDIPDWWFTLGTLNKKLGKTSDAKSAYKRALAIHEDRYDKTSDPEEIIAQLYLLVVLDREKDARGVLEKAVRKHPDHARLREFNAQKGIDALMADPAVKERRL